MVEGSDSDHSRTSTSNVIHSSNKGAAAGGDHFTVVTEATTAVYTTAGTTPFYLAMNDDPMAPFRVAPSYSFGSIDADYSSEGIDVLGTTHNKNDGSEPSCHHVNHFIRQQTGALITHPVYKRAVLALILFSQVILGIRTWLEQQETADENDDNVPAAMTLARSVCNAIVWCCLVLFTMELTVDVLHHRFQALRRGWIVLDILVVASTWWTGFTTVLILRGFRLMRALRKATTVPTVRLVIKALLRAVPYLVALAALLSFLLYMFAVLFTDVYLQHQDVIAVSGGENDEYSSSSSSSSSNHQDFCTMRASATTLLLIMMGGRLWDDVMDDLAKVHPAAAFGFVFFTCTAVFAFGGMAIAILVQSLFVVSVQQSSAGAPGLALKSSKSGGGGRITRSSSWTSPVVGTTAPVFASTSVVSPQKQTLEQRVETLSRTVEQLLGMQVALHESMNQLLAQRNSPNSAASG